MSALLFVTMQPHPSLPLAHFNEWYNNEHGPTRLRLPMFVSGGRWRAIDGKTPKYLAVYEVRHLSDLEGETYTALRRERSPREAEAIGRVDVHRRICELVEGAPEEGKLLRVVHSTRVGVGEHGAVYKDASGYVALEYYEDREQLAQRAQRDVSEGEERTYELIYTFGPAPRDLLSLSTSTLPFTSPDNRTITVPGPGGYITSHVGPLTYRFEGNPAPEAPCIALCNSLLTTLHMWDPLVSLLLRHRPDLRILRFDIHPSAPLTLPSLTEHFVSLLDALRVDKLALVGVSMGAVLATYTALLHPHRVGRLVAADFNHTSTPGNAQAWGERVALGERDMSELARRTVERWFHSRSLRNAELVRWMRDMVARNDVDEFRNTCCVLFDYDLAPLMEECQVPSRLVVGSHDGKITDAMRGVRGSLGGAELREVPETGHLPMVEDPEAFWEAIEDFI